LRKRKTGLPRHPGGQRSLRNPIQSAVRLIRTVRPRQCQTSPPRCERPESDAGEGAVRRAGGVPPHAETRDYVPRVLAAWRVARGLCRTPPELPGDGCVFVLPETRAQATTAPGS
jgi:hypothetical protein